MDRKSDQAKWIITKWFKYILKNQNRIMSYFFLLFASIFLFMYLFTYSNSSFLLVALMFISAAIRLLKAPNSTNRYLDNE